MGRLTDTAAMERLHDAVFPRNWFGLLAAPLFEFDDDDLRITVLVVPRQQEINPSGGQGYLELNGHSSIVWDCTVCEHFEQILERVLPRPNLTLGADTEPLSFVPALDFGHQ